MIQIKNLAKGYRDGAAQTEVLRDINLSVEQGEFVSIVGRSGCGKTTLLNIIGGLDTFDRGSYFFKGQDISKLSGPEKAKFRNTCIGYVFQSFNLVEEENAIGNVAMPLGYAGKGLRERKARAMELLKALSLQEKAKRYPSQLSGGEQQRIAILRALAMKPDVILADEPTGNLDDENAEMVMALLRSIHQQGTTLILVTHDMEIAKSAGRMIRIDAGRSIDINSLPLFY